MISLPYFIWPQTARFYFYVEGVYILLLAFVPMEALHLRNFITFSVLV